MAERYDLILRGGNVVLPWTMAVTDIGVRHGRIVALGVSTGSEAEEVFDATGLVVLPGLIDAHVHFRDPGDGSVESIETGSRAAILGGIATVFDMPNTTPPIMDSARLAEKQAKAERLAWCDMGLYIGATKENIAELALLERGRGVCGIKVFTGSFIGELLIEDDSSLEWVMRAGTRRIAYHAEDEYRLRERRALFSSGERFARHEEWHDVETAFLGTRRILALARRSSRPAHLLHVSTEEELAYVRDFRDVATVEVLINHLTEVAPDVYEALGGYAVMNPPIRSRRHREAAWRAVANGTVDVVSSDHAPHPRAAKERPWPETATGLTGVQTILPLMLDHVAAGRLSFPRLADLMAAGPARVYGLAAKGRIAAGFDADFTLVDPQARRVIEEGQIVSPCGWTPFAGRKVTGWPVATILRGMVVMREGSVFGPPSGRLVLFAA